MSYKIRYFFLNRTHITIHSMNDMNIKAFGKGLQGGSVGIKFPCMMICRQGVRNLKKNLLTHHLNF